MICDCTRDRRLNNARLNSITVGRFIIAMMLFFSAATGVGAVEMLWVETEASEIVVTVQAAATFDPTTTLKLTVLTEAGSVVDSRPFAAQAGEKTLVRLDGQWHDLANRGWQHRIELEENGSVSDVLNARFLLDCSVAPCDIVARPGVRIDGAVAVDPALASMLTDGGVVDFAQLALSDPTLRTALYETGGDWAQKSMGSRCACLFLAGVTGGGQARSAISAQWESSSESILLTRFDETLEESAGLLRAGHESYKEVTMDFACFRTTSLNLADVWTTTGLQQVPQPVLEPCSRPCAPQVEWRATEMDWEVYLDNGNGFIATAAYDVAWSVDGAEVAAQSDSWQLTSVFYQPFSLSGTWPQAPAPITVSQLPSSGLAGGTSWVEAAQMSEADRPQLEVWAGYDFQASGSSQCGGPVTVEARASIFADGAYPATLPVVIGPQVTP